MILKTKRQGRGTTYWGVVFLVYRISTRQDFFLLNRITFLTACFKKISCLVNIMSSLQITLLQQGMSLISSSLRRSKLLC